MARKIYTLGRQRFAKISAVEGISLTRKQVDALRDYEERGLSPEERRKAIVAAFGASR